MLELLPLERGSPEERLSGLHPCSGVDSSLFPVCSSLTWWFVVNECVVERSGGRESGNKVGLVARLSFPSQVSEAESCVVW